MNTREKPSPCCTQNDLTLQAHQIQIKYFKITHGISEERYWNLPVYIIDLYHDDILKFRSLTWYADNLENGESSRTL